MTEQRKLKTYRVWQPARPWSYAVVQATSSFQARRDEARRCKVDITDVCAREYMEGETG